jgi:hypothetical protein
MSKTPIKPRKNLHQDQIEVDPAIYYRIGETLRREPIQEEEFKKTPIDYSKYTGNIERNSEEMQVDPDVFYRIGESLRREPI